jgi:hypothetical protein
MSTSNEEAVMTTRDERKAIENRINELARANDGNITPDMVWQDAQDEDSPLYNSFEWDKNSAWNKHNLQIARNLIASVTIEVELIETTIKIPKYTRDPSLEDHTQGYMDVTAIDEVNQRDLAKQIISQELGRTRQALARAQSYATYFKMEKEIAQAVVDIKALEETLKAA